MAPETLQHPNGTRPRVALSDDPRRASPAPLQTRDINRNPRFSYMETPAELQRSTFNQFSSPTNSSIDESPNFALPPQPFPIISQDKQNGPYPIEKAPPPRTDIPYTIESPHQVHPAHFAPYAEVPIPQQRQEPELPPLPQTPGPIPIKTNEEPMSSMPVSINLPSAGQTKDQSVVSPPRLERRAPTYNPDSLAGPNVAPESHRPGQVSHPNATISPEWKHGLCEFDTTCCVGICCPCMVYGKTQYRLLRKAQKQDPTDLLGYESCNGSCGLMSVLCGFQCMYICVA